ncbi:MAG: RNA-binding transcriptional accessory protein [Bacteroidales bacterium]|nr:RNA-binding transcriptional accessory protein [Bacteroidales bacterium]MCF6342884.1 RNA-binding transcriptional accessory protein [Bacteroidales bacterium]
MDHFLKNLSNSLEVASRHIGQALALFDEGASIPFIARYRKERTGGLTDIQLLEIEKKYRSFKQLQERKKSILKLLKEQAQLSTELEKKIEEAGTPAELEDLYLPFKPKRKTRATLAREKGLLPLAKIIQSENITDLTAGCKRFTRPEKGVVSCEDALNGARDILAEWYSETEWIRRRLRVLFEREAVIRSRVIKGKESAGEKFQNYFEWEEPAVRAPAHRVLAMIRGETAGFLRLKVEPEKAKAITLILERTVKGKGAAADQKRLAVEDAVKRLIFPSLETEIKARIRQQAEEASVSVFADNLKQLLLAPPLGQKNVLAIDPGFRSGCKLVCLDRNGKLLNNETIYPHPPQRDLGKAVKKIKSLVNAYKIEAIAIGNGTAGRETEEMIKRIHFDRQLMAVMVNEDGASVYSASATARKEFPGYDVTVRGAVSIGRRLLDPLAELVKIDPKAIGVGQYQHDVNQKLLHESLRTTVALCVNSVGVDLNTASIELLTHVSGIGPVLASNILAWRAEHGDFTSRQNLKKVKGLGAKAFEQSAGFLRIKNGKNPLDASGVHPEQYALVARMAKALGQTIENLVGNQQIKSLLNAEDFLTEEAGLPTIEDILDELEKPGRDPRKTFRAFEFDKTIRSIERLETGMTLPGIVTNITDFGAFVDIGLHENGLLHKSRIADEFVRHPSDYLQLNQHLKVRIIEVDVKRKRISLSLR